MMLKTKSEMQFLLYQKPNKKQAEEEEEAQNENKKKLSSKAFAFVAHLISCN